MTLVLSALTPEHVVQVSDQRVLKGNMLRDDASVKAVLLEGHTAFAYTGLARLPASEAVRNARGEAAGYRDTSLWLAEVLSLHTTLDEMLAALQAEGGAAIKQVRTPLRDCAQAFVGVGWAETPLEPVLYQVANFGKGKVTKGFEATVVRLRKGDPYGVHASKAIPPTIDVELHRQIKTCLRRELGPGAVARVLVETIRRVSRSDRSVGRSMVQVCLPRSQVVGMLAGKPVELASSPPDLEHATFLHIPGHMVEGQPHSPVVVHGGTIIRQLVLGEYGVKLGR